MTLNPKPRRTQAERTATSDNAIYKAAIKLIAENGPNDMSLAKLGKVAGFSGGLISYRFGSKSNMLKAVADRIVELWKRRVLEPALQNESALADLKTFSKVYFASVKAKTDLMLSLFCLMNASYSTNKELQSQFSKYDENARRLIRKLVEKGIENGEIKKTVDPHAFAVIFIATFRGTAQQYFVDETNVDLDKIERMVADMLDVIKLNNV